MKRALTMAAVLSIVSGSSLLAGDRKVPARDGPALLGEALRTGTADAETVAAIVRWVLEEEPEEVAPGLASALRTMMDDGDSQAADPRWDAAARAAVTVFQDLLEDARTHRRRDAASLSRDLAPLVEAAAPAVADALREVDPRMQEALRRAWERLAPAAPCSPPR